MARDVSREADREESIARREHQIEDWLHQTARFLSDPEAVHARADRLSQAAERHLEVAKRLRERSR